MKKIILFIAAIAPLFAQDVFTTGTPAAGVNVTTADLIQFRDVSVTTGAGKVKPMTFGELVNVPGLFSAVPNGTFSLAKLAQSGATTGQVVKWNGTAWAPAADASEAVTSGAVTTALGFTPVNPSSVSNVGGANKIVSLSSGGDFTTGAFVNDTISMNPAGNVFIPDMRGIEFLRRDGTRSGQKIWGWDWHGGVANTPEMIIESPLRIALIPRGTLQIGGNDTGLAYPVSIEMTTGGATVGMPLKHSPAVVLRTKQHNGTETLNRTAFQAVPLAADGTDSVVKVFHNASVTNADNPALAGNPLTGLVTGIESCVFHKTGIWTPGVNPDYIDIGAGATVTLTCSRYKNSQNGRVTLTQNTTLVIDSPAAGMTGVILTRQAGVGSYTLALPANSALPAGWALGTAVGAIDALRWHYDGSYFYWSKEASVSLPLDSDASAFISATGASAASVINDWVTGLKAMGLWDTSVCWPMLSTQNHSSGTVLKSLGGLGTFDGTLVNAPTRGSTGITFNGTSQYVSLPNPAQGTALAAFSMFSVFDSDGTTNRHIFGSYGGSAAQIGPVMWAGGQPLQADTTAIHYTASLDGTNINASIHWQSGRNTGVMQTAALLGDSALLEYFADNNKATGTARATYWNNSSTWEMGARNISGSYSFYFAGVQAFNFFSTTRLSEAQHTTLRNLYKTTLGAGLGLP